MENKVRDFLAGRTLAEIAKEMSVSRQTAVYWAGGKRKPHPLRMVEFLTLLGKPWGRILSTKEVWPNDNTT